MHSAGRRKGNFMGSVMCICKIRGGARNATKFTWLEGKRVPASCSEYPPSCIYYMCVTKYRRGILSVSGLSGSMCGVSVGFPVIISRIRGFHSRRNESYGGWLNPGAKE